MSYSEFNKDNIEFYLNELAKEYKKLNRKGPEAEVVLVGGAAMLLSYNFRDITTDIDGIIVASSSFKDAVNIVGDRYNLPNGWLNSDFTKTRSYSPKLREHSKYYKTFYGCVLVRIIEAEYIVAMKLVSARIYKKDLSDIVGVLSEQDKIGKILTKDKIVDAVIALYGDWNVVSEDAKTVLESALKSNNLSELYESLRKEERENRDALSIAEDNYKRDIKENNVDEFIKHFRDMIKS